jgi:hypothetical protein
MLKQLVGQGCPVVVGAFYALIELVPMMKISKLELDRHQTVKKDNELLLGLVVESLLDVDVTNVDSVNP